MPESTTHKKRFLLILCLLLIVAVLLPSQYAYRNLSQEILAESRENAIRQLTSVQWMLVQHESFESLDSLQDWITELGSVVGVRITYIDENGRVIVDSEIPLSELPKLENFSSRPEILQMRNQEVGFVIRHNRFNQKEYIYTAKKAQPKAPVPPGIIRLATPFSSTSVVLDQLRNSFLFALALLFAGVIFVSYLLMRQISSPIHNMVDATNDMGSGNFKRRIRFDPGGELYPLAQSINRMAEGVDSRIRSVMEQKRNLEAVFNGMREGVMVLDSRGRIQEINRALARLVPNTRQCKGRRPLEVFLNLELQEACDRFLHTGVCDTIPCTFQVILGGERTYDVSIVKLQDEGRDAGAILVFHDITELKRLEMVRQDFVANVSHELRTPLSSIKAHAEDLLSDARKDPETVSSFLQILLKNINHMVTIVDDLLQLARLERRDKRLKAVSVDAEKALLSAWEGCLPLAEKKSIRLDNRVPEGIRVTADHDELMQVFRNLLENGIRYSPENESLEVVCEEVGDQVKFAVSDKGPGIQKEHQQRIFERFYRVEKDRGTMWGTTGLGLAVCRHVIQSYGGKIWVKSPNKGDIKGSTFFFTLLRVNTTQHAGERQVRDSDYGSTSPV